MDWRKSWRRWRSSTVCCPPISTTAFAPANSRDFIRWAGFYEAKQEREAQYRQLVYEHLRELRRRSGLGALALDPAGA